MVNSKQIRFGLFIGVLDAIVSVFLDWNHLANAELPLRVMNVLLFCFVQPAIVALLGTLVIWHLFPAVALRIEERL